MPGVRITATLALTSIGAALLVAGCGASPDQDAPAASERRSSAPSAAATPRPQPTHQETPRHERPARHKVDRYGLAPRSRVATPATAHLLAATRMPAIGGATWTVVDTPAPDPAARAVGGCQKVGMAPIGAMQEVRRGFRAPGGLTATQLVARFPDPRSAARAHAVLQAWRDDCERRVSGAAVEALEPVAVPVGDAVGYRAAYSSPARTAGLAVLRAGAWLTVVEVRSRGAYPARWDPARVAVRRAARTF